jgi:hypothetical protein
MILTLTTEISTTLMCSRERRTLVLPHPCVQARSAPQPFRALPHNCWLPVVFPLLYSYRIPLPVPLLQGLSHLRPSTIIVPQRCLVTPNTGRHRFFLFSFTNSRCCQGRCCCDDSRCSWRHTETFDAQKEEEEGRWFAKRVRCVCWYNPGSLSPLVRQQTPLFALHITSV